MPESFPATGHRYLVDFKAFRVELYFESETSLTYTGIGSDGSRGGSETVTIAVEPIRDRLFLVTWQEGGQDHGSPSRRLQEQHNHHQHYGSGWKFLQIPWDDDVDLVKGAT